MEDSLLNNNYTKILDIIGVELKDKKQVKKNRDKIKDLLFKMDNDDKVEDIDEFFNKGFEVFWKALPEEIFDVPNIEKLNLRIYQFVKYIFGMESEFKDHGFSLIVAFYFKITEKFLSE